MWNWSLANCSTTKTSALYWLFTEVEQQVVSSKDAVPPNLEESASLVLCCGRLKVCYRIRGMFWLRGFQVIEVSLLF